MLVDTQLSEKTALVDGGLAMHVPCKNPASIASAIRFSSRLSRTFLGVAAVGILPAAVSAQVVYTATLNSGLGNIPSWQSAIWAIDPAGGPQVWPDNTLNARYDVVVPTQETIRLDADVTVRSLRIDNGLTFQNGVSSKLLVQEGFQLKSGQLVTLSAVQLVLNGTSLFTGKAFLQNGSSVINNGNLTAGENSAAVHSLAPPSGDSLSYDFLNAPGATATFSRIGDVVFQNFRFLNTGLLELTGSGTFEAGASYNQSSGTTRIEEGNTLKSNNFSLTGGSVFGRGNALQGNVTMAGLTLEIGAHLNEVASLTVNGNITGAMTGTSMVFDLGGTSAGVTYDRLTLPGGNFDGVKLDVGFVNGFQNSIKDSDSFTIITGNNFNGTFSNQSGNILTVGGLGTFNIVRNNNSVVLSGFVPVPEPETWAVFAATGLLGFALLRRRSA
jgi:hypothetical protein